MRLTVYVYMVLFFLAFKHQRSVGTLLELYVLERQAPDVCRHPTGITGLFVFSPLLYMKIHTLYASKL